MPERRRRLARAAVVTRTERLSTSLVRVVAGGPGLVGFEPSPFTDSYVKVILVPPEVPRPLPRDDDARVDLDAIAESVPPAMAPRMRSYTVRGFEPASDGGGELTLDFVVHGDVGLAGPWASGVTPGEDLLFLGPSGGYAPDPGADRHLLVGDLSALPAMAVALERLPEGAVGDAVVEVPDGDDELALTAPSGVRVDYVHQGTRRPGAVLVEAVLALPPTDDDLQAFVHGEAGAVRELRRHLRRERGIGLERLSASGYWRLGVDDEGWRSVKREWNAAVEQEETAAAS